ncbi:MAG: hypothetical protein HY067_16275 [Betaproteobacteria bacterium]|nr:hypothetical protein [Betaproteobacteria bacterium]
MDMQVPFNIRTARRANPVLYARNQEICNRYAAGETLAAIGSCFGISSERVRKILKKFGLDKTNGGLAIRNRNKPRKPPVKPYSLRVYGCTAAELDKFTHAERLAFLQQRTNGKRTDVPWRLTLPQWCDFWFRSGKWTQRGRGPFKYGLCRIDSSGAFSVENVLILKNSRSARREIRATNQLPALEFHREAWILARLQAAWAENRRTANPALATNAVQESAYRKYWEQIASSERERLKRAEIREK